MPLQCSLPLSNSVLMCPMSLKGSESTLRASAISPTLMGIAKKIAEDWLPAMTFGLT
ncbi:hypothetical protein D3C80_1412670 [compost metagenome]